MAVLRRAAAFAAAAVIFVSGCTSNALNFNPLPQIGVENTGTNVVVHVRTCANDRTSVITVREAYGLEGEPRIEDAVIFWEARAPSDVSPEVTATVGELPSGFEEIHPLVKSLPADRRLTAEVSLAGDTTEGVGFDLAEIPAGQLKSMDGRVQRVDEWDPEVSCP